MTTVIDFYSTENTVVTVAINKIGTNNKWSWTACNDIQRSGFKTRSKAIKNAQEYWEKGVRS